MNTIVTFAFLCFFARVEAADVTCVFKTGSWVGLKSSIYYCEVQNSLNITTKEEAIIDTASPTPTQGVKGFFATQKHIRYFPRDLDKIFPSMLEMITILACNLEEIKKDDLKPFPNLTYIRLEKNSIEAIEQDLFSYNPNLENVDFESNRITHIDPNVFDHLSKLGLLWLRNNVCVNKYVTYNATALKSLITELKTTCVDPQYSTTSTSTTTTPTTTTAVPSPPPNSDQLSKCKEIESRLASLEKTQADTKAELKADIIQTQYMLQSKLTDVNARISFLEMMSQKIIDLVEKMTAAEENNS